MAAVDICPQFWLPEILDSIARFLPQNEISLSFRLVNRALAQLFRDRVVVRLSLPSPPQDFRRRWATPGATRSLTLLKRRQLVALTAASGDLANLEVALECAGCLPDETMLEAAAAAGQMQACEWLRQRGCPWGDALPIAALAGQQDMCEWLLTNGCAYGTWDAAYTVCAAARGGHVGLMEHLLLQEPDFSSQHKKLLTAAAEGCDLATLQRLHNEWGCLGPQAAPSAGESDKLLSAAARSPTPDWQAKVEWVESLGCLRTTPGVCKAAAACPDSLPRLTWLLERGYPANASAVEAAARAGNVASLEYLLAGGVKVKASGAAEAAVYAGDLAVLQALHMHGCPLDAERLVCEAARRGESRLVLWVVEVLGADVQQVKYLMDYAALSGSVELLELLRSLGASCGRSTLSDAASGGCEAALEWLVERGCPMESNGWPYVMAGRAGDLATLRCLKRLGCPWTGATFTQAMVPSAPLPVLSWLLEAGCPVDWKVAMKIAEEWPNLRAWLMLQQQRLK